MGRGNFLIKSTHLNKLMNYVDEELDDYNTPCALRVTDAGVHMTLASADCGVEYQCDDCGKMQCIGCGKEVMIDLDEDTVTCRECDVRDIWEWILFEYRNGRQKAARDAHRASTG